MSVEVNNLLARSAARTRPASQMGSGRAFIVEAMLMMAFLGLALALTVQLFVTASTISQTAHYSTTTQLLATRIAETATAQCMEGNETLYFDKDAKPCDEENATYIVKAIGTMRQQGVGRMLEIEVHAQPVTGGDGSFSIQTQRYLPYGGDA